jgi:tetratricopeptide (TPR) repeat protein
MPTRCACALVLVVCLGCDALPLQAPARDGKVAPVAPSAQQLWQRGQEALLDGRTDDGIALYQQSLATDPTLTRNHLSLAAAYLEKGDDEQACVHLRQYVAANPEHLVARVHLADLLRRLKRPDEARVEFERYITAAQDQPPAVSGELVHCHTQLVDLAEADGNEYAEHVNRGIGLYLLAEEGDGPADGDLSREALLFRAAGELSLAHRERPDEARPRWYLYLVWSGLAQRGLARHWLGEADEAAPFTFLTPAESRGLQLAWHAQHDDLRR